LRERIICSIDHVGAWGCLVPTLSNLFMNSFLTRNLVARPLGFAWQRPLPRFANQRFDRWFRRRTPPASGRRGRVVLWDDTFVRYHEPQIGIAATKVLEAAGFKVELATGRKCCGRPAFSQGHLDRARRLARHNLALLNLDMEAAPIIFLEPSCYSMFVEDYRELAAPGWERIARRCILFERFIDDLLTAEPGALRFRARSGRVVIHPHCHLKSLMSPAFLRRLALRLPGREVTLLDSSCCGMAGAFGALREKYELSLKIAEPLVQMVRNVPQGAAVVASGTSCRQQLSHLAPVRPRHMAELLAAGLEMDEA
jgi:Fe-S oxidoreductase